MRAFTLRGRIPAQETRRLIVDDGRYTHGMIVKQFTVWAKAIDSSEDPECILTKQTTVINAMDASDSNQIGWASQATSSTSRIMTFNLIDPDHVITQDLFIRNIANLEEANYLIVLEPVQLTADEGVLQLIKDVNQSV